MWCSLFFTSVVWGNVTGQCIGDSRINHDRVVGSEKSSADNKSLHNILDLCFYSNLFRWFIFMKVVGVVELEAHWKARRRTKSWR